jgi:hypothetical protein
MTARPIMAERSSAQRRADHALRMISRRSEVNAHTAPWRGASNAGKDSDEILTASCRMNFVKILYRPGAAGILAALDLCADHGCGRVTVETIASRAGVSKEQGDGLPVVAVERRRRAEGGR